MQKILRSIKWYFKDVFIHPFISILYLLPTLITVPFIGRNELLDIFILDVDMAILPIIVLVISIFLYREPRVEAFEINIFGSMADTFIGRIVTFLLINLLIVIPLNLVISTHEDGFLYLSPLNLKIVIYLAFISVSFLLPSYRGAFIYLSIVFLLLPYIPPILLNRARSLNYKLDPIASIITFFIGPLTATRYIDYLTLRWYVLEYITLFISLVIIFISFIAYMRKEINI